MKKILAPAVEEDSVFYSDFTGKCFGRYAPEVVVSFCFNYGSKYDNSSFELHLTDEEAEYIIGAIKSKLSLEAKKIIISKLDNLVGEEHLLPKLLSNDTGK